MVSKEADSKAQGVCDGWHKMAVLGWRWLLTVVLDNAREQKCPRVMALGALLKRERL